jgi:hypothetical protein
MESPGMSQPIDGSESTRPRPGKAAFNNERPGILPDDNDLTWKLRGNPVSDQSTATDKLGFRPYVDAVAAFLLHKDTQPPLTMSVEGEWGTGKSSFMRQLKAELERAPSPNPSSNPADTALEEDNRRRKTVLTFWFNAWRHDKQDAMWATFALSITKQMRDNQSFVGRYWGDLKLAAARIESAAGWVHVAVVSLVWLIFGGGALAVVALLATANSDTRSAILTKFSAAKQPAGGLFQDAILPLMGQITAAHYWLAVILFLVFYGVWFRKRFGKRLDWQLAAYLDKPDYKHRAAFIEGFHSDFRKVINAYAAKRRIFIFVDDLDRCDVPRAAELMQAINLMIGDDNHLIFILGMDREKIAAGIALKYRELIPFLEADPTGTQTARHRASFGYSYLEKFIQITFRVPRPGESGLEEFLKSMGQNPADRPVDEQLRKTEQAIRRAQRKNVEVRSRADSAEVQQQVMLVAPALEWNPRRIKQFINDFRLQAYIASDLGLLDLVASDDTAAPSAKITLEQLGKYVAITLAWPDLVMDLIGFPGLLAALYQYHPAFSFGTAATKSDKLSPHQCDLVDRWREQPTLMNLLVAKCDSDNDSKYSLANTDLRVLLNITPRVDRTHSLPDASSGRQQPSSSNTNSRASPSGGQPDSGVADSPSTTSEFEPGGTDQGGDQYFDDANSDRSPSLEETDRSGSRPIRSARKK